MVYADSHEGSPFAPRPGFRGLHPEVVGDPQVDRASLPLLVKGNALHSEEEAGRAAVELDELGLQALARLLEALGITRVRPRAAQQPQPFERLVQCLVPGDASEQVLEILIRLPLSGDAIDPRHQSGTVRPGPAQFFQAIERLVEPPRRDLRVGLRFEGSRGALPLRDGARGAGDANSVGRAGDADDARPTLPPLPRDPSGRSGSGGRRRGRQGRGRPRNGGPGGNGPPGEGPRGYSRGYWLVEGRRALQPQEDHAEGDPHQQDGGHRHADPQQEPAPVPRHRGLINPGGSLGRRWRRRDGRCGHLGLRPRRGQASRLPEEHETEGLAELPVGGLEPVANFGDEKRAPRVSDAEIERPGEARMIEGPQGASGLQELLPPLRGSAVVVADQLDRDRRARLEVGAMEDAHRLARGDLLLQKVAFGDPAQLAHKGPAATGVDLNSPNDLRSPPSRFAAT